MNILTKRVLRVAATPGYFDAIGSALLAGRVFEQRDLKPDSPLVVIVNETFAKHFWPGQSPSESASGTLAAKTSTR